MREEASFPGLRIVAIVPCHNEEQAIAGVVAGLLAAVPQMVVYVYDNGSTDRTAELAASAGAIVRTEPNKGKGHVVRRAFADVEADVYLMIDGDGTYETAAAPRLIATLLAGPYDQVVGVRRDISSTAYRPGHALGNRAFNYLAGRIFRVHVHDMLSGYRVFSRRFVKSFPAVAQRFETETELTVHAATLRLPQTEIDVDFMDRADGSESKLRTYRDGWAILRHLVGLTRAERPVVFHSIIAAALMLLGLVIAFPVFVDYVHTGLVPKFPSAILAASVELLSCMTFFLGLTLQALKRIKDENMRLHYLALRSVSAASMDPSGMAMPAYAPSEASPAIRQPAG